MKQGDCTNIVREIIHRIYGEQEAFTRSKGEYPTRITIGTDLYNYMLLDYNRTTRHPDGKVTIMGMEAIRCSVDGLIMVGKGTVYRPEEGVKTDE